MSALKIKAAVLALLGSAFLSAHAAGFYVSKAGNATYLPAGPGWTEVTSITVGSGNWVIHSSAPAVNFGATDITRCAIFIDGVLNVATASMLGGGGGMPAAAELSNLALLHLYAGQVVGLYCGHDANVAGQRIDPGATLVITRAPKT